MEKNADMHGHINQRSNRINEWNNVRYRRNDNNNRYERNPSMHGRNNYENNRAGAEYNMQYKEAGHRNINYEQREQQQQALNNNENIRRQDEMVYW